MCTLAIAHRVFESTPIAVAANRDEAADRPSTPPRRYLEEPVAIAPVDEEAGGTWIGYNADGLFVGITNRWVDRDGDRSRGLLVRDCLRERSAAAARETVESAIETDRYAGFNLVVADLETALLLEWDGDLDVRRLDPGVHVVGNVGPNGERFDASVRPEIAERQADNVAAVREALQADPGEAAIEWLDRAGEVLGDHDYGVCLHEGSFGTRSTSLIALTETDAGIDDRYFFADGPPCRTPFRDNVCCRKLPCRPPEGVAVDR